MLQDNSATQAAVLAVVCHVLTAASESLAGERRYRQFQVNLISTHHHVQDPPQGAVPR